MTNGLSSEWLSFLLFLSLPMIPGMALWKFSRLIRQGHLQKPWQRLLIGNLLVLLFLVLLAFLALESWFRFVRDTTDSFNYSKTSQRWFARHYQKNNFGMRDNERYEFRIAPGKRRITFVGDSFSAGQGIANVEDRFANVIRRTVPNVEVHLLAVPGFETGDELGLLSQLVTNGYQLDIVVLGYCLNDISDLVPEWQTALQHINADQQNLSWLEMNSYFANTMHYRLKARRDPNIPDYFGVVKDAYKGPAWERQKQRLTTMHRLVTSAGGKFAAVTFPFFHALGPGYEWGFVHQLLDAHWHEHGVPHLDLLPVYQLLGPDDLMVNKYDAHPNELAHLMAADAILKMLNENAAQTGANSTR